MQRAKWVPRAGLFSPLPARGQAVPGQGAMSPIPRKRAKRRHAIVPGFRRTWGNRIWVAWYNSPWFSSRPGRRRRELNVIPDLFHYCNLLLSHSTTLMFLQGKKEKISKATSPPQWESFSSVNVQDILPPDMHEGQPG